MEAKRTLIRIKRCSIRRNPDAGRTHFMIPGRTEVLPDGSMHRNIQHVHTMTPSPDWLCEYIPTIVQCGECGARFVHTELRADAVPGGEDEIWSNQVCPKCGEFDCCDIEFEQLTDDVISKYGG